MKKLSLVIILAVLPYGANAEVNISTCNNNYDDMPSGYCCASIDEVDTYLKCDNLNFDSGSLTACKTEHFDCINYCTNGWERVNGSVRCKDTDPCDGEKVTSAAYSEDCEIPNALYCSYDLVCDLCGKNCHRENETVDECDGDNYYMTEDWTQCLKCPGNSIVDWDLEEYGITTCYIPRSPMTGSDATGTFKYVNDKCYYKE